MQTKSDLRRKPGAGRRRRKSPRRPGGKVLQRLFTFLGQRDPALNDDLVATVPVPKSVRPTYALTDRALRAKAVTPQSVGRRRPPAAKPFAEAIVRAATRLPRPKKAKGRTRKTAHPAGIPGVWQEIGPRRIPDAQTYGTNRIDVAGRVAAIAVDPNDSAHILVGAAGGGIWETHDTGATWEPRSDQMPSLAMGAIAFDPKTPSRVFAGSGEGNFYLNLGAGVYKSTDGGATWNTIASSPFIGVGFFDLVIDPKTPSTMYAGTTRGFFKSTNSGASWSLKKSGNCWDISVHPQGGDVEILAAFATGLFESGNGGNSFTPVALPSKPSAAWLRLGVDRVADFPDVAYVFGAAGNNAFLWRRNGTTWQKQVLPAVNHDPDNYFPDKLEISQAEYDWCVAAPPNKIDEVFVGAIDTFRGQRHGTTWTWKNVTTQGHDSVHPDQHCLVFSPGQAKIIYSGNDGGIYRSSDSGTTWKSLNKGLGICEIEYLASDPNTWEGLIAGTQDNGTIRHDGAMVWKPIADGDGGDCGINQIDPNTMYHSFYDVSLERSTNQGQSWTDLEPPPFSSFANPPTSLFYPPVEVSGLTVAIGAKSMIVTRTGKKPWDTVSLGMTSGELPSAMREIDANTLLIGTTAGRMLRMTWNGTAWKKIILTAPTVDRYISCIAVDPSNSQRFWVTISQVGGGRVFRSDDGGGSWVNRSSGLPNIPFNAVVVDPANFQRVWIAADVGVYETQDLGASWTAASNGLPNAMATDLLLHQQDRVLICATRNRGAWVMRIP